MDLTFYIMGVVCVLIKCVYNDELGLKGGNLRHSLEFTRYSYVTVIPRINVVRDRRHISPSHREPDLMNSKLSLTIPLGDRDIVLDLTLNNEIVPTNNIMMYQRNGRNVYYHPDKKEIDCDYTGRVRGVNSSWAELCACAGLLGTVHDGTTSFQIEPVSAEIQSIESAHYMYRENEGRSPGVCGNKDKLQHPKLHREYFRQRRSPPSIPYLAEPHNANADTLYNELVLVIDKSFYEHHGRSLRNVYRYCKLLTNHLNSLYIPLNIYIVLIKVYVWTERDEFIIQRESALTLNSFMDYRKKTLLKHISHDNAHLITKLPFEAKVIGRANIKGICTMDYSGGVNSLPDDVVQAATVLAHEMGHNFGMDHDNDVAGCSCRPRACIMNKSSGDSVSWSACSRDVFVKNLRSGDFDCMRNKPSVLFGSPTCGNGFVEPGEQCDCGPAAGACAGCCDVTTCRLRHNSTCASGACCDRQTCSFRPPAVECRRPKEECDLPEYCTGDSEQCSRDLKKMDSERCAGGKAFCYEGTCRLKTNVDKCRRLWGPTAQDGGKICYKLNELKTHQLEEDKYCGALQCHAAARVTARFSGIFVPVKGGLCYRVHDQDVGMVADGTVCAEGKMCVAQKCVEVAHFRKTLKFNAGSLCPSNCSGHGVCNSEGECHCHRGFAPPMCTERGAGGSQSSGPSAKDYPVKIVQMALYTTFLGVIPFLIIIYFLIKHFCNRKHVNSFKLCSCCIFGSKMSTLRGSFHKKMSRFSNDIVTNKGKENDNSASKSVSANNVTDSFSMIQNASPAEIKLIRTLTSTMEIGSSTSAGNVLERTFNCDFKSALKSHKEKERNSKPSHDPSSNEQISTDNAVKVEVTENVTSEWSTSNKETPNENKILASLNKTSLLNISEKSKHLSSYRGLESTKSPRNNVKTYGHSSFQNSKNLLSTKAPVGNIFLNTAKNKQNIVPIGHNHIIDNTTKKTASIGNNSIQIINKIGVLRKTEDILSKQKSVSAKLEKSSIYEKGSINFKNNNISKSLQSNQDHENELKNAIKLLRKPNNN